MAEARKPAAFVHLRVKSAYSLLEGAIRPKDLAALARKNAMPAVGITDVNNLFGVYEISEALAKGRAAHRGLPAISRSRRDDRAHLRDDDARAAARSAGARPERDWLSQSRKTSERSLSRRRAGRLAACESGGTRSACRRTDRADRRPRRAAQPPDRGRPAGRCVGTCSTG